MASKHKNVQKYNTATIPVRELAMVSIFCLWNAIFFVWIMPGDGMFYPLKDGEAMNDYPHMANAFTLSFLWGFGTLSFFPIAKYTICMAAIFLLHPIGTLYIATIVMDQTRSQASCLWPPCGLC